MRARKILIHANSHYSILQYFSLSLFKQSKPLNYPQQTPQVSTWLWGNPVQRSGFFTVSHDIKIRQQHQHLGDSLSITINHNSQSAIDCAIPQSASAPCVHVQLGTSWSILAANKRPIITGECYITQPVAAMLECGCPDTSHKTCARFNIGALSDKDTVLRLVKPSWHEQTKTIVPKMVPHNVKIAKW